MYKYVKRKYQPGGLTIDYGSAADLTNFDASTFDFDAAQMSSIDDQFTGTQKLFQEHGASFQDLGTMDKVGMGMGTVQELVGAFQNPYDDLQGQSKGDVLMQQGTSGVQSALTSGNPLNLLKTGTDMLDTAMSDDDATTYTGKEIGADVAGLGVGIGRIIGGDVVGGVQQTASELIDIGKSTFGRKKAREEQEKENYAELQRRGSIKAQELINESNVEQDLLARQEDAAASRAAAYEKYGFTKQAEYGARIHSSTPGTRPVDLRQEKSYLNLLKEHQEYNLRDYLTQEFNTDYSKINKYLSKGGKVKFEDGGKTEDVDINATTKEGLKNWRKHYEQGTLTNVHENEEGEGVHKFVWGDLPEVVLKDEHVSEKNKEAALLKEMYEKNPLLKDIHGPQSEAANIFADAMGFHPAVAASLGAVTKGSQLVYNTAKTLKKLKNLDVVQKRGIEAVKQLETGGVTPGEFSHKTNPLTVVDKNGQDTGMELTGGEGVFDESAMKKLDKYKKNKNYNEAGKLVFAEMESWKAAGTAKYGTRIKDY